MPNVPLELRGRYERRGAAAVDRTKLILDACEVLEARWADLGGRWLAEPRTVSLDAATVLLGDEETGTTERLAVRRVGEAIFLVEERHLDAFDACSDPGHAAWVDCDAPGRECGCRVYRKVNLGAFWAHVLDDLRAPKTRADALARLAHATLWVVSPGENEGVERIEARGALVEGLRYVDAGALLDEVARAKWGIEAEAMASWSAVVDRLPLDAIPASVDAAVVARFRAARDD